MTNGDDPVSIDASLFSLLFKANFIVQCVMVILMLASLLSWMIIFQKGHIFRQLKITLENFEFTFTSGVDLSQLYNKTSMRKEKLKGLEVIFISGFKEFIRLHKYTPENHIVILQGVKRAMRVASANEIEQLEQGLPFLATVQSISPFIGLFGTVWGIMHAFRDLGTVQQATLTMVAPGISEALIATAMGLIAAIPAGIAYNRYINQVDRIINQYKIFSDELTGIMHRTISANSHKQQQWLSTKWTGM